MSFKPTPNATELCNRALSRLGQDPISSVDPPSPPGKSSRACARWYKSVVARLLETHHWGLARERVTLTAVANDRGTEWLHKFELPVRVAFPVSLAPMSGVSGVAYYRGLQGLLAMAFGRPAFLMIGRYLYSRYEGDLDFVSYDITEADFNATFENIVELSLAAAMAYDITKSRPREKELREQATIAINMAIAQDMNAGGPRYGDGPSERDWARGAVLTDNRALSWDWWPGATP